MMPTVRELVATSLALFAWAAIFSFSMCQCAGCTPADTRVEAAAGYEAQQMACVDQYADKPSIDKCRARVKTAWAASDAGAADASDAAKDGAK